MCSRMRFEPLLLLLNFRTSDGFFSPRAFDGKLDPLELNICTSQNITFTCRLLDLPVLNHTIGFSVKIPDGDISTNYIPIEEANVTTLNETVSQLTIYVSTEMENIYIKCSYWKEFGDMNRTLQLGEYATVTIHPRPEPVRDFNCIMFSHDLMNCTWDYGKDQGIHLPDIIFQWRIPSFSSTWEDCPSKDSIKKGYCVWSGIPIYNTIITIRLILKEQCGETFDFDIYTLQTVMPKPVDNLTATRMNRNITCILVKWDTSNSGWSHPMEHKVTIYETRQNKTKVERFNTLKGSKLHNRTVCDLRPYTNYEFSVSIRSIYSEYFSDERKAVAKTFSAKPSASPEVIDGGYSWRSQDCRGNVKRHVCIYWKPIKEEDKNGKMTGLVGMFKPKNAPMHTIRELWPEDLTYGCKLLMCNTSYTFNIKAMNDIGESVKTSKLEISSGTLGLRRPRFVVESADNSDVHVNWTYHDTRDPLGFTVAWCRNKNGNCENNRVVNWEMVPPNMTNIVIQIDPSNAAQDYLYGVSAFSDQGSSGFEWQDCVYLKNAKPSEEPQNVVVTEGPDDNTLIVTWDKLVCKSDQPYIEKYNIQYINLENGDNKSVDVTAYDEARVVLTNLEEGERYKITIKAVTKNGQYGPASKQKIGIPVNRSLKPSAIVGITIAVLVCVIFAGIGCFCAIRRCKNKAKKVIREAGNITIPDDTGLDFNPSKECLESFDSGYGMTEVRDKTDDLLMSQTSAFVSQDDNHSFSNKWKDAVHGFSSDSNNFDSLKDTKMLSVELQNYSYRLDSILEIPRPLAFIQESDIEMLFMEIDNTESINEKTVDIATDREESTENSESPLDAPSSSWKSNGTEIKINMQYNENQLNAEPTAPTFQTFNAVELLKKMPSFQDDDSTKNSDTNTLDNMVDRLSTTPVNNNFTPQQASNENLDYITPTHMLTEPLFPSQNSHHIPEISTTWKNSDACSSKCGASVSLSSREAEGTLLKSLDGYVTSVVNPSSGVPTSKTNSHVPVTQTPCEVSITANVVEEKSTEASTFRQFASEEGNDQHRIPKTILCNKHLNADQSENHSTSVDTQGRTLQTTKGFAYPDIDFAKPGSSHSASNKNETGLGQASCMPENTGFTPGICPQSVAAQTSNSNSYLPCAHANGGYVSNNTVENHVPVSAAISYVPHCAIQDLSNKVDEHDSIDTFSTYNKVEVYQASASPETDYRTNRCNNEQTDVDKVEDNIQSINVYLLNNQPPRQFKFPTPDTSFHSRQDDIQPTVLEETEEDALKGFIDEKSVLNKPVTIESRNDGYVDHTVLKKINVQVNADEENVLNNPVTVESRNDGYVDNTVMKHING